MEKNRARLLALGLLVVCLSPLGVSAITYDAPSMGEAVDSQARNVTFVAMQGKATPPHRSGLVALDTDTKQVLWKHDEYRTYFDVSVISDDRIAFVAGPKNEPRHLTVVNWRTDEIVSRTKVGKYTHDAEVRSPDTIVAADMLNNTVYIYNRSTGAVEWEFDLEERLSSPEAQTHVNDVDVVDNGTKILTSPRNYDRVVLIDVESKNVSWVLGAEDEYDVLNEQHNPVLLTNDPPTVLVADSENDRIVEYRNTGSNWRTVWTYRGALTWPRDADRLPDGNTLIVDSGNDRVLEVNPNGDVMWEWHTRPYRLPYDVERVQFGDEPAGPSYAGRERTNVSRIQSSRASAGLVPIPSPVEDEFNDLLFLAQWVTPPWFDAPHLLGVLFATVVLAGWVTTEVVCFVSYERLESISDVTRSRNRFIRPVVAIAGFGLAGLLVAAALAGAANRPILLALAVVSMTKVLPYTDSVASLVPYQDVAAVLDRYFLALAPVLTLTTVAVSAVLLMTGFSAGIDAGLYKIGIGCIGLLTVTSRFIGT